MYIIITASRGQQISMSNTVLLLKVKKHCIWKLTATFVAKTALHKALNSKHCYMCLNFRLCTRHNSSVNRFWHKVRQISTLYKSVIPDLHTVYVLRCKCVFVTSHTAVQSIWPSGWCPSSRGNGCRRTNSVEADKVSAAPSRRWVNLEQPKCVWLLSGWMRTAFSHQECVCHWVVEK